MILEIWVSKNPVDKENSVAIMVTKLAIIVITGGEALGLWNL